MNITINGKPLQEKDLHLFSAIITLLNPMNSEERTEYLQKIRDDSTFSQQECEKVKKIMQEKKQFIPRGLFPSWVMLTTEMWMARTKTKEQEIPWQFNQDFLNWTQKNPHLFDMEKSTDMKYVEDKYKQWKEEFSIQNKRTSLIENLLKLKNDNKS